MERGKLRLNHLKLAPRLKPFEYFAGVWARSSTWSSPPRLKPFE